jgi:hypothetical protein
MDWELFAKVTTAFVAIVGIPAGVVKYFIERAKDREQRERELAWKRAQFMIELSERFHQDKDVCECIRKLEETDYNPAALTDLERLLRAPSREDPFTDQETDQREKFNRFLALLDDVSALVEKKVLTEEEAFHFGWYLYRIDTIPPVSTYCAQQRFYRVLDLCERIKEYNQKRQPPPR